MTPDPKLVETLRERATSILSAVQQLEDMKALHESWTPEMANNFLEDAVEALKVADDTLTWVAYDFEQEMVP